MTDFNLSRLSILTPYKGKREKPQSGNTAGNKGKAAVEGRQKRNWTVLSLCQNWN